MTENPNATNELIYEILKDIRSELLGFKGETRAELRDIKGRLGSVEGHIALMHTDLVRHAVRNDEFTQRLTRIETQLNLLPPQN